ncbi:MAG: beta-galactosidase [Coriobacteriia bacterium]|nr:beta-galactosidase [Coriobacteriia bacterium]
MSSIPRNRAFPIGIDLHPLSAERQSPEDWYADGVESDLDAIAEAGIWLVRLFVSWRCLEPQVGQYDEEMFDRFDGVIAHAKARGLKVVVCFFADDRLAELTDVPGARSAMPARTTTWCSARSRSSSGSSTATARKRPCTRGTSQTRRSARGSPLRMRWSRG